MTRTITVYSGPTCAPCTVAKNRLDAAGIPFTEIDLSQDEEALADLKRRLNTEKVNTPVIQYGTRHEQINGLTSIINEYQEANRG